MTTTHTIGIVMNGVTGRMGKNQHLYRSILAIIRQGGVALSEEEVIMPNPILVGRSQVKLQKLALETGIERWSTDVAAAVADPRNHIYFDAQTTDRRFESVKAAIEAGKHVYCEKPTALTTSEAVELHRLAENVGVKHGVVQDKLWLPGLMKLKTLKESGFFGQILSVKADFGYWVFEGDVIPPQRPSWNYRSEAGGGIILDMFPHWRYILDHVLGKVKAVSCLGTTHIKERIDESGKRYSCTADDAAYAIFELADGIVAQFNSSWSTRVRRDDLVTFHIDGTKGSAVAGLRDCHIQPYHATPRPVWNPDVANTHSYYDDWQKLPDQREYENAFKVQWELFLRHVVKDDPFPWNLMEGAKGVQLAELGLRSWHERKWIDVPAL